MLEEAQRGQLGAISTLGFNILSIIWIGLGGHCNIWSQLAVNIFNRAIKNFGFEGKRENCESSSGRACVLEWEFVLWGWERTWAVEEPLGPRKGV